MEPSAAVAVVEQDLRSLIEIVLGELPGDEWLTKSGLTQERLVKIAETRKAATKKRGGGAIDTSLVRYTNLFDLGEIVAKNWERFKPVFENKKKFEVYFERLEAFRNALAHSRELLPFEHDLLAGISGEIRNSITIYRSTMGPSEEYYPRIESVRDSFGNEWVPGGLGVYTNLVLEVGQKVEFLCRGWDPQGRAITWVAEQATVGRPVWSTAIGTDASLVVEIRDDHVGEDLDVAIVLTGTGKYHRHSNYDDTASFRYAVRPPADFT